jgi:hypothetical protein
MPDTHILSSRLGNLKQKPKSINHSFGSAYSGVPDWYRIVSSANSVKKNLNRNPRTPGWKKNISVSE